MQQAMDLSLSEAGQNTLGMLMQKGRDSWGGATGERRAADIKRVLSRVLPEYATALGLTQDQILQALEERRDYSAINYYQDAKLPPLSDVTLFDTMEDFKSAAKKSEYRCPMCGGISTDAYTCNSGKEMEPGKVCDWKSYGLFGTLGKGLRVVIRDKFLDHPGVHEIFMPVAFEK